MIEIILPWPLGLSPNCTRTTTQSSRTGHEKDDREIGRKDALDFDNLYFNPVTVSRHEAVKGGRVVLQLD